MRHLISICCLLIASSCVSESESLDLETSASEPSHRSKSESLGFNEANSMNTSASGFYALEAGSLEGAPIELSAYAGKVTLVVNVASECGYTKQYAGLQKLQDEMASKGFSVLGFPSNEFGGQEPGSAEAIREFCTSRFNVTFPMFAKCEVKEGGSQSPLYSFLEQETGESPNWNFCKYLVGKDGQVIGFYKSSVEPDADELRKAIETAL